MPQKRKRVSGKVEGSVGPTSRPVENERPVVTPKKGNSVTIVDATISKDKVHYM
jgi:hypothetical protein